MLTLEQKKILADFTWNFENHSVLPEICKVSLLCNQVLERIFLLPEEIEEIEMSNRPSLPIERFRKLKAFRDFLDKNKIRSPYSQSCIDGLYETFFLMRKDIVLDEFFHSSEAYWNFNTERFILLFELIEHDYERTYWYPLSFKGLEHNVWYDDWLGM